MTPAKLQGQSFVHFGVQDPTWWSNGFGLTRLMKELTEKAWTKQMTPRVLQLIDEEGIKRCAAKINLNNIDVGGVEFILGRVWKNLKFCLLEFRASTNPYGLALGERRPLTQSGKQIHGSGYTYPLFYSLSPPFTRCTPPLHMV